MKKAITFCAVSMLACGPTLKFTSKGPTRDPRPPTCEFTVLTTTPPEPHEVLGTIDIQYDNTGFLNDVEPLKKKIRPEVCKVGGNAVIPIANDYHTYIKVTVLSLQPATENAPATDASPTSGSEETAKGEAEL
jgi:hypothetical protein